MLRFIPTPVGNTLMSDVTIFGLTVHPHARGEHYIGAGKATPTDGSSPRPWGTHHCRQPIPAHLRFIPTPVGNTVTAAGACESRTVHPHARGEHSPKTRH